MIPLDHVAKWTAHLDASAQAYLSASEFREYENIPAAERQQQIRALLERPIASFTIVNDVYFRARWSEVLSAAGLAASPVVLEIASGDTDVIPQMMGRDYPNSRYIAANMNRRLTAGLREKTRDLSARRPATCRSRSPSSKTTRPRSAGTCRPTAWMSSPFSMA